MPLLRFEGASDDTFGEYAHTNEDHDNCANGLPIVFRVVGLTGEGLFVWGCYSGGDWPDAVPGCWMIGTQQLDEGLPIPPWPIRLVPTDRDYSHALEINAPDGVAVEYVA